MLKIYDARPVFQINRQKWDRCGSIGWICMDESEAGEDLVLIDKLPFHHAFEAISASPNDFDGLMVGQTLFRHRPYIEIGGGLEYARYFAKQIHTFSYKVVFREKKNVTIDWITEHLSADEAIQYFKERGMNVCPIKSA